MSSGYNQSPIRKSLRTLPSGCPIAAFAAPSRVTISSSGGQVTLSGTIQYEHQRQQAMKAVQGVSGG